MRYLTPISTSSGCGSTDTRIITVENTPTVSYAGIVELSYRGAITVSASSGYMDYQWNRDGVVVQSGSVNSYIPSSAPGVYTVKVTNTDNYYWESAPIELNRIVYAIADGNWNDPAIWSFTLGGQSMNAIPLPTDKVAIAGYDIKITSEVTCTHLIVDSNGSQFGTVEVSGSDAFLIVHENINLLGPSSSVEKVLTVANGGKIECK